MIVDFLDSLVSLGLFENVAITFDGGFSVNSYEVVCFAFFLFALVNVWIALKFLLRKVL